ncbi:arf-GAP domain and FG repeat-containing protein 2-like, partial [Apteryx rowi]|uniref:arf-GAP domain and FG repeat-containing protein 2-like n=1 Tax=Apteryx rowi TaxID=308060 RepID=UPI000E1C8D3D
AGSCSPRPLPTQACRKVWLGAADPRAAPLPDSRDPQKVKEFLQEKYEKKRWYVSPERAKAAAASSLPSQGLAAEAAPAQTLLGDAAAPVLAGAAGQPRLAQNRPPPPAKKASTDLLADIGGDPFAAPQPAPAFAAFPAFPGQAPAHAAFANFDAFGAGPGAPAFGGAAAPFHPLPAPTGGAAVPGGPAPARMPEVGGASVRYRIP